MATRTPQRNTGSQGNLRSSSPSGSAGSDGVVFHSMKEFWFWVAIVTLIIAGLMILSFLLMHTNKLLNRSDEQLNKANALVQRLEQREKLTQQKEK
jgi:hypothetical protein